MHEMSARLSREARRGQIVSCTLALLADTPIDRLTTRQVARALGISQPALFRHFRSRDEIFEAVVRHARAELEGLAAEVLGRGEAPLDAIAALIRAIVGYVARHPGMPRLLFYDAGADSEAAYHGLLAQLVSLQRSLATELLHRAQRAGALDSRVDAARAAVLLIAALQGLLLQWQLSGRAAPLEANADAMLSFWRAGLAAGEPARGDDDAPEAAAAAARMEGPALVALEVRPILEAGRDPLGEILAELQRLPDDGVLKLVAPFRPTPLLALLADGEQRSECRELDGGLWGVEILGSAAPEPEDLRELEAPEPLERILIATAALAPGASYTARTPRHPRMLLPRLAERGLAFEVYDEPDGSALVHVRRPA
jgi:TetR/AcrR family transcriptional regulator